MSNIKQDCESTDELKLEWMIKTLAQWAPVIAITPPIQEVGSGSYSVTITIKYSLIQKGWHWAMSLRKYGRPIIVLATVDQAWECMMECGSFEGIVAKIDAWIAEQIYRKASRALKERRMYIYHILTGRVRQYYNQNHGKEK